MAVTPDARTDAAMIASRGYDKHDFNTFIQLYLDRIKDSKGPIPDSWLFSYEIPKSQELSRKSVVPCYFAEIRNMAAEYDIHPQQIILCAMPFTAKNISLSYSHRKPSTAGWSMPWLSRIKYAFRNLCQ